MKCVRNPMTNEIKRLPEAEARKLASYGWQYVSKSDYKAYVVRKALRRV